jgi:hypothetical protein
MEVVQEVQMTEAKMEVELADGSTPLKLEPQHVRGPHDDARQEQ